MNCPSQSPDSSLSQCPHEPHWEITAKSYKLCILQAVLTVGRAGRAMGPILVCVVLIDNVVKEWRALWIVLFCGSTNVLAMPAKSQTVELLVDSPTFSSIAFPGPRTPGHICPSCPILDEGRSCHLVLIILTCPGVEATWWRCWVPRLYFFWFKFHLTKVYVANTVERVFITRLWIGHGLLVKLWVLCLASGEVF